MDDFLAVSHVSKIFSSLPSWSSWITGRRQTVHALCDVSFGLGEGHILGVFGPNGAGKSTLLKIISTLVLPDEGDVRVRTHRVGKDDEKIKSICALMTSEERSFYWRLTGRQNLEFFGALFGLDRQTCRRRINEVLEFFRVDYADRRFDTYSSGMKQKFGLMRSLIHRPRLLLLDEPFHNLDPASFAELKIFVREKLVRQDGLSVLLATHQLPLYADFFDSFLLLDRGRVQATGSGKDVMGVFDRLKKP